MGILACVLFGSVGFDFAARAVAGESQESLSHYQIGYTEYRTNLPGGRYANNATMRACVIGADGSGRCEVAHELIRDQNTFNQFSGWSPDGRTAILANGYNTPENAAWEEANHTFRFSEGWLFDGYLLNMATGQTTNVSAPERMSNYNGSVSYWPGNPNKLLGGALINGVNHPVSMNLDGTNKVDLTSGSSGFTYGSEVSPDGTRIAYHSNYQVYVANADGSNPQLVNTGASFNFMPRWSPDGQWLEFLSGPDYHNCNPYLAKSDGTGLRKLGDRNGMDEVPVYDVPDFHGGSSDWPEWSPIENTVYYTSLIGQSVELMQVTLAGVTTQLTHSTPGTLNYLPTPSPDGKWIMFGSNSTGTRQLYVMPAAGGAALQITNVGPGSGAMFGCWNPILAPEPSSTALMVAGGCSAMLLWRSRCWHVWKKRQEFSRHR
jgi:TolB protein